MNLVDLKLFFFDNAFPQPAYLNLWRRKKWKLLIYFLYQPAWGSYINFEAWSSFFSIYFAPLCKHAQRINWHVKKIVTSFFQILLFWHFEKSNLCYWMPWKTHILSLTMNYVWQWMLHPVELVLFFSNVLTRTGTPFSFSSVNCLLQK